MRPVNKKVLVKEVTEEKEGSILILNESKPRIVTSKVVSVAKDVSIDVSEGDTIAYHRISGVPIEFLEGEHVIVDEKDIIGVL